MCGNPFRKRRRRSAGELLPPGLSARPPPFSLSQPPRPVPYRVPRAIWEIFFHPENSPASLRPCKFSEDLASPGGGRQAPVSPFAIIHASAHLDFPSGALGPALQAEPPFCGIPGPGPLQKATLSLPSRLPSQVRSFSHSRQVPGKLTL